MWILGPIIKTTANVMAAPFGRVPVIAESIKTTGDTVAGFFNTITKWSMIAAGVASVAGLISVAAASGGLGVTPSMALGPLMQTVVGNAFRALAVSPFQIGLGGLEIAGDATGQLLGKIPFLGDLLEKLPWIGRVFAESHSVESDLFGKGIATFAGATWGAVAGGVNATFNGPSIALANAATKTL